MAKRKHLSGDQIIGASNANALDVTAQALRVGPISYPADHTSFTGSAFCILDRAGLEWDASIVMRTEGDVTGEIGHTGDGKNVNFKVVTGTWPTHTYIDSFKMVHPTGYIHVADRLGIGTVPVETFHIGKTDSSGRVLAKMENGNAAAGSRSVCFALTGGNASQVSWTFGTDYGLNGNNNFFIKDENGGPGLFIDGSGRVSVSTVDPLCTLDVNGAMRTRPVTLTDAATIATNAALSNVFRVTLNGNRTLGVPTNPTDGQRVRWEVTAGGGSNRTLSLATGSAGSFKFGTTITSLSATTSALTDMIECVYNATIARWCVVEYSKGF